MKKIDLLLNEYGESHQNKINKLIHWICVPNIFFSIIGMVWCIPDSFLDEFFNKDLQPYINWATLSLCLVLVYYIMLSIMLAIGMGVFSCICIYIAKIIHSNYDDLLLFISIGIFITAWIFQFIGHNIEGKKPSFFKDIQFLLIGPSWLLHFIYKKLRISY